jgi:hypothetical protein
MQVERTNTAEISDVQTARIVRARASSPPKIISVSPRADETMSGREACSFSSRVAWKREKLW